MSLHRTILPLLDTMVQAEDSNSLTRSVNKLRALLKGVMPSVALRQPTSHFDPVADSVIAELHAKIEAEELRNAVLIERLEAAAKDATDRLVQGSYPLEVFLDRLHERRQQSYGWRTDYVRATQITPEATLATTSHIQHWQHKRLVPFAYVDQIPWLIFPKRTRKGGQ